jgi:hypothetical protein
MTFQRATPKSSRSLANLLRFTSHKSVFDLFGRITSVAGSGAKASPPRGSDHEQHILETLGIDDLIAMEIPARELLLDPILPAKGLTMIHARRGGSKTFLALAMGLAVASGTSLLRWSAPKARHVLYADGEMTLVDLQKRLAALKAGIGVEIRNDHFRLLAADHTDVPDLATEAGQRALDPLLEGVDLLIVDNISTLCWTGSDNDAGSWTLMQEWILRLRRRVSLSYWCTIPAKAGSSAERRAGRMSSTPSSVCDGQRTTSITKARGLKSTLRRTVPTSATLVARSKRASCPRPTGAGWSGRHAI